MLKQLHYTLTTARKNEIPVNDFNIESLQLKNDHFIRAGKSDKFC